MWEQYCSCPWCDGYKTWRCIQEIHTRRDTNCQHTSKFTTLTKPRPYFLSLWRALRRNLCFLCLALYICWWNARKWEKRLTVGSRESDQCANSKTHHRRHQREHFPGILHIDVLLVVSTFCHSPIHKIFHSSSILGCPLQPPWHFQQLNCSSLWTMWLKMQTGSHDVVPIHCRWAHTKGCVV